MRKGVKNEGPKLVRVHLGVEGGYARPFIVQAVDCNLYHFVKMG
jgi:hypothetical protein